MLVTQSSTLVRVPPADLDRTWPLVANLLDRAYFNYDHLTPDLLTWLKAGEGLLWLAITPDHILSALTSSFVQRRSGKVLRLWAVGGTEIEHWKGHLAAIEDYARANGCVKVAFDGRRGWARALIGYRPTTISFEKGL